MRSVSSGVKFFMCGVMSWTKKVADLDFWILDARLYRSCWHAEAWERESYYKQLGNASQKTISEKFPCKLGH